MRLVLLACAVTLFAAADQVCFPPSCKIDSNCYDDIHFDQGRCCGGVCTLSIPDNRLVGQTCSESTGLRNRYETCVGTCAAGLFCGDDRLCHAQHGPGCNCTNDDECLSSSCAFSNRAGNYTVCRGSNLAAGLPCVLDSECSTNKCVNFECQGYNTGESCSADAQCASPNVCKSNYTYFSLTCQPLCPVGLASCCTQDDDCEGGRTAPLQAYCKAGQCLAAPGLGDECSTLKCNNRSLICASACNYTFAGSECSFAIDICQLPYQKAIGDKCSNSLQCPKNATCFNSGSGGSICADFHTVTLGGRCSDVKMCASPGDICSPAAYPYDYTYICKVNRSIPVGSACYPYSYNPPECVTGSECIRNATGAYVCSAPLAAGSPCTDGDTCADGVYCLPPAGAVFPYCFSSVYNCTCQAPYVPAYGNCTDDNFCMGYPNVTCRTHRFRSPNYQICVLTGAIKTGEQCAYTDECLSPEATCVTAKNNYTCQLATGMDCDQQSDCYARNVDMDCGCNRKCYVVRRPTPAPPARPPPAPTPDVCASRVASFINAEPEYSAIASTFADYYYSYNKLQSLILGLLNLPERSQRLAIDVACCYTCPYTTTFYSHVGEGYQVDCSNKSFVKLKPECGLGANPLAFLNCWAAASPASTLNFGFGLLFAGVALLFF